MEKSNELNQRYYNIGFKLALVSQVEKGELTYKPNQVWYSGKKYCFGMVGLVAWIFYQNCML
jgi:hypothetical protein